MIIKYDYENFSRLLEARTEIVCHDYMSLPLMNRFSLQCNEWYRAQGVHNVAE